jgi:hypothetical protein
VNEGLFHTLDIRLPRDWDYSLTASCAVCHGRTVYPYIELSYNGMRKKSMKVTRVKIIIICYFKNMNIKVT